MRGRVEEGTGSPTLESDWPREGLLLSSIGGGLRPGGVNWKACRSRTVTSKIQDSTHDSQEQLGPGLVSYRSLAQGLKSSWKEKWDKGPP